MEYTYDALGRQQTIRAPYEIESGQPFTIRFEYFPAERKAHTIHYSKEGNIDTYTFADSLMRAVQTKQTGVVWSGGSNQKVSIVSGRAVIDAFGRNIAAYYPMTESHGNIGTYNHATGDLQAKTEYDAHDRTMSVTLADGSVTRTAYSIGSHDGEPMLQTTVTDALGRHAESYTDAKGRNRETVQHARGEDIMVKYSYDPVGQVMTVQHPNGRETKYAYDLLGRKLVVNHPDAGETNMTYDAAGNLLTKLTAELRKSISDKGYISYTYDFERLHEVLYPENLFNRVTYTYGKAGDKYNRAGRLALVEDASGGEAYYYGRQRKRPSSFIPFKYQGQYADKETGLYYNRFRYYDPNAGSYISQDPIGLAGDNPTLYAYVSDVNYWNDVLGLTAEVYKLVATKDGYYDVYEWGNDKPVGKTHLKKGDTWKIGETTNFRTKKDGTKVQNRYTKKWLDNNNLKYEQLQYSPNKSAKQTFQDFEAARIKKHEKKFGKKHVITKRCQR